MARNSSLTDQQIDQIHQLNNQGKSERTIAQELGLSRAKVKTGLRKVATLGQQKIAALVSGPVAEETKRSVFDIMDRLEECLTQVEELMTVPGELKERVMVRTEKRMLIAEARATLESIYNIRVLNDFITEVTTILESESPGARQRIFKRLEASAGATAAITLFASGGTGAGRSA